ncbi:MAG TPA: DNA-3-methyladenine glycosylase [Gemmatimonadaceae bacterium]|nr:DNA-3-methyladenine glycosylase [Gemmatimonadaceae bacterium]
MSSLDHRAALRHLRTADPVMARLIRQVGTCRLVPRRTGTHFEALARAIVYQQLSGKAAATIHGRVLDLYPRRRLRPELVRATEDQAFRGAGLSRQKIGYLRDLAEKVETGVVPLGRLDHLDDETILERLTAVKGIGRWTVQMFLMFRLGRPDVLPELDLGVQNAIHRAYGLVKRPSPKQVLEIGTPWRPHASVAAWYLWRSLEGEAAM